MNFLADESVDQPIVDRLRQDGHNVLAVAELEPSIPDETVLIRANQGEALLLTTDKDFGELVFRQRQVTEGVVLIRLAGLSARAKAGIVSAVIRDHEAELTHAFTVISPGMIRIRPCT
jgi:predicted nuclease of predicted toxin-antitoxin system